jgi:hypothetical protein
MVRALGERDFSSVYRLLRRVGFTVQRIAAMTGQSQPEVSAIIRGRKVMAFDVMRRIVDGLSAPACVAGMLPCNCHRLCPTSRPVQAADEAGEAG